MNFYRLQTFVTVAREGSIRKASELLNSTPPTVSGHIKALEEEFLIKLFDRLPRGMKLTSEGKVLLKKAERIMASAQDLHHQVAKLKNDISGEFRIGLNASSAMLKAAELALEMKKYPGISITFEASSTIKIMESLQSKAMDAGFLFGNAPISGIETVFLRTVDLCIAMPPAFRGRMAPQDWRGLAKLPWICSDGYCPFQNIATDLFEKKGHIISNRISTNDEDTKVNFVRRGVGVALLLLDECREGISAGEIMIWDSEPIKCDLYFAYPAEKRNDPVYSLVKKAIQAVWR